MIMIFPMFCNKQIVASLAKFWHQLGKPKSSRNNSGTDKGEAKVVKTEKEEQCGNFAMSVLKERNGYVNPTEMKEREDLSQQNEMENRDEGLNYWSTIYSTDIC